MHADPMPTPAPTPRWRVLVAYGSKLGGTAGIARSLAETFEHEGFEVTVAPAAGVRALSGFDAVVLGGALYANRWHADARRFVARHEAALRRLPVWLFSSGPLDDSADGGGLAPPTQVAVLMERIGARGHMTFGGRLAADAKGFPAAAMAKTTHGDWRNPRHIHAWAKDVAHALPAARPNPAIEHPARAPARLVAHALAAGLLLGALWVGLGAVLSSGATTVLHALLVPAVFAPIAVRYFKARGAREPLPSALIFALAALAAHVLVVAGTTGSFAGLATSVAGTWLPPVLAFLTAWLVGFLESTLPWPKPPPRSTPKPTPEAPRGGPLAV